MMDRARLPLFCGAALLFAAFAPASVNADVTRFLVEYSAPFGTYNGRQYEYVEGLLEGTVTRGDSSTGTYKAPATMIYPVDGGTSTTLVSLPNSFFYSAFGDTVCDRGNPYCDGSTVEDMGNRLEDRLVQAPRALLEDHLYNEGVTFLSVQWSKGVTELFGANPPDGTRRREVYGEIERGTDADFIIQDAASFARDTSTFDGGGLVTSSPANATAVVAWGHSQTSMLLNTFRARGLNKTPTDSDYYDGFIQSGGGGFCSEPADVESNSEPPGYNRVRFYLRTFFCFVFPQVSAFVRTDGEKVMSIVAQTDMYWFDAPSSRNSSSDPDPDYRQYEIAGAAHLPSEVFALEWNAEPIAGVWDLNPVSTRPIYRAALTNMIAWIRSNTAPPTADPIDLSILGPSRGFQVQYNFDADGNTQGGIRLPHMPSTLPDSSEVGSPVGVYGGFNAHFAFTPECVPMLPGQPSPEGTCDDPVFKAQLNGRMVLAGGFVPFSTARISELYPTAGTYQTRITAAADQLLTDGFILQRDRDAYAAGINTPPDPSTLEPDPEVSFVDSNCATNPAGGRGLGFPLTLVASVLLLAIRRRR